MRPECSYEGARRLLAAARRNARPFTALICQCAHEATRVVPATGQIFWHDNCLNIVYRTPKSGNTLRSGESRRDRATLYCLTATHRVPVDIEEA